MSQGASFWQWYARVNDDVRHQLVDRMWFGQHARDNAFERDVSTMAAQHPHDAPAPEATVYTHNPHVPAALEGIGARGRDDFNAENVKGVMEEFYGRRHGHAAAHEPEQQRDQAGQGISRDEGQER